MAIFDFLNMRRKHESSPDSLLNKGKETFKELQTATSKHKEERKSLTHSFSFAVSEDVSNMYASAYISQSMDKYIPFLARRLSDTSWRHPDEGGVSPPRLLTTETGAYLSKNIKPLLIQELLYDGVDFEKYPNWKISPLFDMLTDGDARSLSMMISAGIDLNVKAKRSVAVGAAAKGDPEEEISLIRAAFERQDWDCMRVLAVVKAPDPAGGLKGQSAMADLSDAVIAEYISCAKASIHNPGHVFKISPKLVSMLDTVRIMVENGFATDHRSNDAYTSMLLLIDPRYSNGHLSDMKAAAETEKENKHSGDATQFLNEYNSLCTRIRTSDGSVDFARIQEIAYQNEKLNDLSDRPSFYFLENLKSKTEFKDLGRWIKPKYPKIDEHFSKEKIHLIQHRYMTENREREKNIKKAGLLYSSLVGDHIVKASQLLAEGNRSEVEKALKVAPVLATLPFCLAYDWASLKKAETLTEKQHKEYRGYGNIASVLLQKEMDDLYVSCCEANKIPPRPGDENGKFTNHIDFSHENADGHNILDILTQKANWSLFYKTVVEYGADPNRANSLGDTVIDTLVKERNNTVLKMEQALNGTDAAAFRKAESHLANLTHFALRLKHMSHFNLKEKVAPLMSWAETIMPAPGLDTGYNKYNVDLYGDMDSDESKFRNENQVKTLPFGTVYEHEKTPELAIGFKENPENQFQSPQEVADSMPLVLKEDDKESSEWIRRFVAYSRDPAVSRMEWNRRFTESIVLVFRTILSRGREEELDIFVKSLLDTKTGTGILWEQNEVATVFRELELSIFDGLQDGSARKQNLPKLKEAMNNIGDKLHDRLITAKSRQAFDILKKETERMSKVSEALDLEIRDAAEMKYKSDFKID